jgi:hypothetical protein
MATSIDSNVFPDKLTLEQCEHGTKLLEIAVVEPIWTARVSPPSISPRGMATAPNQLLLPEQPEPCVYRGHI